MNNRSLLIVITVLVLVNVGAWYLFKGNNTPKNPQPSQYQTSTPRNVTLPTEPYQTGIEEVKVLYIFSGHITEVALVGDNLRTIKLDNAPKDAPAFTTTLRTNVFKTSQDKATQGKVEDLKIGQLVTLSMAYNIKTQGWELEIITIRE